MKKPKKIFLVQDPQLPDLAFLYPDAPPQAMLNRCELSEFIALDVHLEELERLNDAHAAALAEANRRIAELEASKPKTEPESDPYERWRPEGEHELDRFRGTFAALSDAWCDHTGKYREAELSQRNVITLLIRAAWQLARKVDALEARCIDKV